MKHIIFTLLIICCTGGAHASVINFGTCWSSCANIGAADGDAIVFVASLEYTDNGASGVDFTLTNTVGNLFAGNTTTFISELFFGSSLLGASASNLSSNIDSINFNAGGFTNASLSFNWDTNLANAGGPGNLRLTDGEAATWTLNNFSVSDLSLPAMVHLQALPNDQSVKITDGGGCTGACTNTVPEPSSIALLGLGLIGLSLARRK